MAKEQRHYRGMANSLRNLFVNYQFNYALYIDRHYASKLGILGIGQTPIRWIIYCSMPERNKGGFLSPLFQRRLY